MLAPFFRDVLNRSQAAWREAVALAVTHGIPVPAMSASLAYYDAYRSARLPANLLQAQRDFFGAHTYERTDRPAGQISTPTGPKCRRSTRRAAAWPRPSSRPAQSRWRSGTLDNRPMQGLHLTADLRDCRGDAALMTEHGRVARCCACAAVRDAGLTPVGELFHRFNPPDDRQSGITGVVLLAESHLAVHTWPEIGGVTIDAYVCNFSADNSARAQRADRAAGRGLCAARSVTAAAARALDSAPRSAFARARPARVAGSERFFEHRVARQVGMRPVQARRAAASAQRLQAPRCRARPARGCSSRGRGA